MTNPPTATNKQNALDTLLKKLPSNLLYYGSLVGTIAIAGNVVTGLPPGLHEAIMGIGLGLFAPMIERIVRGENVPDDQVENLGKQLEDLKSRMDKSLTEQQFYGAIRQLSQRQDLLGDAICNRILDAMKSLPTHQDMEDLKAGQEKILVILQNAAPPSPPSRPCNRVPRPALFAGRANELDKLAKLLDDQQAVAITAVRGIGGIGKTTLAQELAYHVSEHFGLKLYVQLGKDYREDAVPRALHDWSGRDFDSQTSLEDMIAETKQVLSSTFSDCGENVLVIIDDVWADTVKAARQLREALPPETRLLVTTRSEDVAAALNARTETLQYMPPAEGADLLLKILEDPRAANYHDRLSALSEALGGHPLALTLAARQLRRNFQPRRIETLIADFRQGMDAGKDFADLKLATGDDKVDSVSVTLRQTLETLGGTDADVRALRQKQFRALGVLPADLPFRAEHIWAIWEKEDDDALADLVSEGLLDRFTEKEGEWYHQHRLLRAYARALLRESTEFDALIANHRKYLINRAHSVFYDKLDHPEDWREINDDLPQIHALGDELVALFTHTTDSVQQDEILKSLVEPSEEKTSVEALPEKSPLVESASDDFLTTCFEFSNATIGYVYHRNVGTEGRRWLWIGLVSALYLQELETAGAFVNILALWHDGRGYRSLALRYHEQALAICQKTNNKQGESAVLNNIGLIWDALGDKQKALDYFEQALPMTQELGEQGQEATTLNNIGKIWFDRGERKKALDYYERALPMLRAGGNRGMEASTLNNIGKVWQDWNELQKALDYYEQALSLSRLVGHQNSEGYTLNNIAMVWMSLSDYQKALDRLENALTIALAIGDRSLEATALNNIGMVWQTLGDFRRAGEYYQRSLPIIHAVGDRGTEASITNNIAMSWYMQGEYQKSLKYFELVLPMFQTIEDRNLEANVYANLGMIWYTLQDKQKSLEYFQRALPLLQTLGNVSLEVTTYTNIAILLWERGDYANAFGHMQTAYNLKIRMGLDAQNEANYLNMWTQMRQTGIYDQNQLAAFLKQQQAQQGSDPAASSPDNSPNPPSSPALEQ